MNTRLPTGLRMRIGLLAASVLVVIVNLTGCTAHEPASPDGSPAPSPSEKAVSIPTSPSEVPRISREELRQELESGANILIVDTRSESEYAPGHIKGAANVPLSVIEKRQWQPPPSKEVILYCC